MIQSAFFAFNTRFGKLLEYGYVLYLCATPQNVISIHD